jgi:phosphate transport system substrate-binding protein
LLQNLAAAYTRPDALLAVNSAAANWETIFNQLRAGDVPFALTAYVPPDANLWVAPVGQDGLAIVVDTANPISFLSFDDLRAIFQGRIANWSELGGPDLPLTVVSRESGADTRLLLNALVMEDRRTTLGARMALSGQTVLEIVGSTPGAIGYVSMAQVDHRVRVVPIADQKTDPPVLPTPETVGAGQYPLRSTIMLAGLQPPDESSIYRDWFAWMQSPAGQAIVGQSYAPLPR